MFGMFFFLTQFLQDVLGFGALRAGIAFLPMTVLLFAVSRLAPRLIPRVGGWRLMMLGMIPVIAGMAWLSRVSPDTTYWSGVFGPMVLLGAGMGVVFVPLTTASLAGVAPQDSGAASSMVNVMQQLGGSVGLAVLVAVFGTATRDSLAHPVAGLSAAAFHQQRPGARHVDGVPARGHLRRGRLAGHRDPAPRPRAPPCQARRPSWPTTPCQPAPFPTSPPATPPGSWARAPAGRARAQRALPAAARRALAQLRPGTHASRRPGVRSCADTSDPEVQPTIVPRNRTS